MPIEATGMGVFRKSQHKLFGAWLGYDNGVRAVALGRMQFRDSKRVVFRLHEVDRPV